DWKSAATREMKNGQKRRLPGFWPSAGSWASKTPVGGVGSGVLAFLFHERADALGQQGHVEGLLEGLVEAVVDERLRGGLVLAGQGDDQRLLVLRLAAQVLGDLQRLAAAQRQVDDDGVGVEALGLDAGLEAAGGGLVLVVLGLRQQFLQPVDEQLLGADD